MEESYFLLSDEKKAEVQLTHQTVRACKKYGERARILAWTFVRGLPYRRAEKKLRVQSFWVASEQDPRGTLWQVIHNQPKFLDVYNLLVDCLGAEAAQKLGDKLRTWFQIGLKLDRVPPMEFLMGGFSLAGIRQARVGARVTMKVRKQDVDARPLRVREKVGAGVANLRGAKKIEITQAQEAPVLVSTAGQSGGSS